MGRKVLRRSVLPLVVLAMLVVPAASTGEGQDLTAPSWVGAALELSTTASSLTNPESTQAELPGLGHKFELIGAMVRDTDPENSAGNSGGSGGGVGGNEGISATMTPANFALAFRNLPPGIKITALDNQLGLKYYFVAPRTCGGGSPRITLLVDADGDGDFDQDPPVGPGDPFDSLDFAAHGHVNPPVYAACPMNKWQYEDLADDLPRWEITPCTTGAVPVPILPSPITCPFPFNPWETLEATVTATFPNHRVIAGFLADDSCSFHPPACGKAHYDLVTIENRTLEIWQDTVKNR